MKYSKLFGKTEKLERRDMKFVSHKFLYKGGFVRELSSGRYEFLPLGYKVWEKIVKLIDIEMTNIGSQRMSIPILQPIEYWKKSNRDKAWGNQLMRIKDRNDSEFALSATGEGIVTEMIKKACPTYKDLPVILHQFIIKFRDEMRPRGGLLRTREFVMKDAYSYHTDEKDMLDTYNNFRKAYSNICEKLGLDYHVCVADSGALGGDYCHEFQVPCEVGEDTIVKCEKCDYAANIEKSEFIREESKEEVKKYEVVELPYEVATIKELVNYYKLPANRFIKNVVYRKPDKSLVIATVTGNLDVNDLKLAKAVGVDELVKANENDLKSIGAKHGFVHSWGYDDYKDRITYVVDEVIPKAKNLYGGYKTDTTDPINVNYGRDFKADIVADIAEPTDGALCKKCKSKLKLIKSVELGHIFKYDHFYTKNHDAFFIDKNGRKKYMYMGAYGIGIGRTMALIVEKFHDDKGIIWPKNIAPYQIHLVSISRSSNDKSYKLAENIYKDLISKNIEVLWDDRLEISAGEKFADSDLIGIPLRVIVSDKSINSGGVEIKYRNQEKMEIVKVEDIRKFI